MSNIEKTLNLIEENQLHPSLVFIAGPPRSGTTWLSREICNEVKSFNFLPECTLLTQQVELYKRTLHHCDQQRFSAYFSNKQNLISYYRDNVAKMLELIVKINKNPRADILVLKDPELSLYLNELADLFPPHKLIILIRDPRDMLASMKNVSARKDATWDIQSMAAKIFTYYFQIENYQKNAGQNTLIVRYEDLVRNGLKRVRSFLNIQPIANDLLNETKINAVRESLDISDPFFSQLYLQPTTSNKVGSYKEILTSTEVIHVEEIFSGVIARWGY